MDGRCLCWWKGEDDVQVDHDETWCATIYTLFAQHSNNSLARPHTHTQTGAISVVQAQAQANARTAPLSISNLLFSASIFAFLFFSQKKSRKLSPRLVININSFSSLSPFYSHRFSYLSQPVWSFRHDERRPGNHPHQSSRTRYSP